MNDFEPSKEQLETVYGGIMEEVNELRLQIARKKTLSAMDHQGKTINTNIAEVQAQNVVFWLLDDIELLDWTTSNFLFVRLWFFEDIHHSSILKLALKKQFRILQMQIFQASCFKMIQTIEKISS